MKNPIWYFTINRRLAKAYGKTQKLIAEYSKQQQEAELDGDEFAYLYWETLIKQQQMIAYELTELA